MLSPFAVNGGIDVLNPKPFAVALGTVDFFLTVVFRAFDNGGRNGFRSGNGIGIDWIRNV